MFEAAEVGHKVSKDDYKAREPELHTRLLAAQRRLREAAFPVIVLVSGVEGAGKGGVVSQLHTWLDARGMQTHTFWDETDEERERPRYWRFWRALPPKGTIGVLFGSWYTQPIIDRVYGRIDSASFERELTRIDEFEHMLADDGALFVKLWYHMSKKAQYERLEAERKDAKGKKGYKTSPLTKKFSKRYETFASVSEHALRHTDTGVAPWHVIESENRRYRDLRTGELLLESLEAHLARANEMPVPPRRREPEHDEDERTVLDHVDVARSLDEDQYKKRLAKYQRRLNALAWEVRSRRRNVVAMFEGWDASGKGGAIRRAIAAIDARLYRVISVAAPTDEERAQHYLWRFWRHLPRGGYFTIYDRSWYGRVLVERVEGFASDDEWMRAYQEINDFEDQLVEHATVLLKFWIHITPDEQLRRFKEREETPWKQHKITEEDWRNREKWNAYESAVHDMVSRTSTETAPWTLVAGNDKKNARIEVLRTFCDRIEAALER